MAFTKKEARKGALKEMLSKRFKKGGEEKDNFSSLKETLKKGKGK